MHVMSSLMTLTDYRNPRGTEVMFQGLDDTTDKVGDSLRYYAVTTGKDNTADVASCDLVEGVTAEFAMHSGTDPHTRRMIIEGTAEPAKTLELTMLGGVTGERTVTVDITDESFTHRGMRFANMFRVNAGARAELGDSGAPLLLKVREGVYRMVGVAFARMRTSPHLVWAFPASAAEFAMGITFGAKLENLDPTEQSGFIPSLYSGWEAVADFSDEALGLERIEVHGASVHWLGTAIPSTGGTVRHRWWQAALAAVANVPIGVRLTIHGGPDTHPWFAAGQVWGFRVYIKRTTDSEWQQVLSGSDILSAASFTSGSDEKAMAVAEFTVPITRNAERWLEYFRPYRRDNTGGDFEVKIEGAPVLPAGVEYLGTLPEGDTTRSGSWSSDIASVHLLGRYAKFYAFRLNRRGRVRLTLESSVDTYMFLLAGAGKNGVVLQRNDDYGSTLDSRITRTLDAGDYTIEATTYWVGRTGDFDLVARLMSGDAALSGLDLSAGELSPAFAAGETSYTASVEHTQNTITVTPTANHRDATITAKGVATASGTASAALPLLAGDNDIDVVVTAEDGTQRTYSITVTRAANPTPTPTTPPGCTEWGPWTDTSETSGCGRARRRLQRRHCLEGVGQPQEQWVDDPEDLSTPWGPWTETSETRGQCDDWEIKETRTRTSNRCRTQTQEQWVTWEGPAETWGSWSSWSDTGSHRGSGMEREKEQERTRTSNRCRTQTETDWVPDPENTPTPTPTPPPPETWGAWSDTGRHRGSGMEREKEQSRTRTSNLGNTQTQTRWVADE